MYPFSANPPLDVAWHAGKTAATIRFVYDAEGALGVRTDLAESEKRLLQTLIRMMRDGQASLIDFETVDEWLERLRDHHP